MAKSKKRPKKKGAVKQKKRATTKKSVKKSAVKKVVKKPARKAASPSKKKATGTPVTSKPADVKRSISDEELKEKLAKTIPAAIPKEPELDDEDLGEEELDLDNEGGVEEEIEEEIEEDLTLEDDDEDVDYLEKSEDLLDDSDDYRH